MSYNTATIRRMTAADWRRWSRHRLATATPGLTIYNGELTIRTARYGVRLYRIRDIHGQTFRGLVWHREES